MRVLFVFCCAITLCGQEPANDTPKQRVAELEQPLLQLARQWIKDPRPLYKAWAADLMFRHGNIRSHEGDLVKALGDVNELQNLEPRAAGPEPDRDDDKMRLAILDTLISKGGYVPRQVSMALLARYPAQALILLVQSGYPDRTTCSHLLQTSVSNEVWLFATDCLARHDGGPVELLEHLRVKAQVTVYDDRPLFHGGTPGGVLGGIFGSVPVPGSRWPDPHTYVLSADDQPWAPHGLQLIRSGKYAVNYGRVPGSHIWRQSDSQIHGDRDEYATEILAQKLAATASSAPVIVARPTAKLRWTTAERYRSDLLAFVAEQRHRYEEFLSALIRVGLLTIGEREGCHFVLEIDVIDDRSYPDQKIPQVGVGDQVRRLLGWTRRPPAKVRSSARVLF
jgi:hypothetical protein